MKEHLRLQKICQLGYRLQELGLMQLPTTGSTALATLHHLLSSYKVERVQGQNLEQTLQLLGRAVMIRHQLHTPFLSVDAVIDFFCRRFLVERSFSNRAAVRKNRSDNRVAA